MIRGVQACRSNRNRRVGAAVTQTSSIRTRFLIRRNRKASLHTENPFAASSRSWASASSVQVRYDPRCIKDFFIGDKLAQHAVANLALKLQTRSRVAKSCFDQPHRNVAAKRMIDVHALLSAVQQIARAESWKSRTAVIGKTNVDTAEKTEPSNDRSRSTILDFAIEHENRLAHHFT